VNFINNEHAGAHHSQQIARRSAKCSDRMALLDRSLQRAEEFIVEDFSSGSGGICIVTTGATVIPVLPSKREGWSRMNFRRILVLPMGSERSRLWDKKSIVPRECVESVRSLVGV
jgi:hypothetical protein